MVLAAGTATLLGAALVGGVSGSQAGGPPSAGGRTTLDVTICPNTALCPTAAFTFLRTGPGEKHVVRQDLAPGSGDRASKRRSLAYFAQISDFQLSDEESPARIEAADDEPSGIASSAWRPQEAMIPHESDRTIRQLNRFLTSPIAQGDGSRASLLNAVLTGDLADSQQLNETDWVVQPARRRDVQERRIADQDAGPEQRYQEPRRGRLTGNETDIDNRASTPASRTTTTSPLG